MSDEALIPEQIAGWYTPKQVVDLLPNRWGLNLKRQAIGGRIQAGTIKTAALRIVTPEKERTCCWISRSIWEGWGYLATDGSSEPFWEQASYEAFVTRGEYGYGRDVHVRIFGIRLFPADVSAMFLELGVNVSPHSQAGMLADALVANSLSKAPTPIPPIRTHHVARPGHRLLADVVVERVMEALAASSNSPKEPPPERPMATKKPARARRPSQKGSVAPAEFDSWYESQSSSDQARSHRALTAAAKKHFQGRRGLKAFIDAVTDGRPRGRPRKSKECSE
jgi:hypothetical protein